ncbi:MAG: type II toxin-antitoxin system RelE/ParE family toxin [Alphaproteobacteria bacterium]|nr:type II toxin-antitoxin system RelE/ParE family toxin [Alphaproteobacteria bacterium]
MSWSLNFIESAQKSFLKLDRLIQKRIVDLFETKILKSNDPCILGKPLNGPMKGLWRYRVGDYRIICKIDKSQTTILVVDLGHRREVYL